MDQSAIHYGFVSVNFRNSYELRSPEFPRTPSAARPEYFTIFRKDEVSYENTLNIYHIII